MGEKIDLHTALVIQNNEVNVETYSNKEKTSYGFVISRMERDNYRMILSTEPIYKTEEEAKKWGESVVEQIRGMDLSQEVKGLGKIIGEEEFKIVSEISRAVNPDS